ncbi:MAG: peptidylprolyl isomerase [Proteobacteria bacterium]|nr:peptidylprolyl isomerase [Pseudomonadota bacterium]
MQRLSLCAAAVAGALLLASCGADDDDAPAPAPTTVLASIDGQAAVDFDLLLLAARARTAPGEFPRTGSGFESVRDRLVRDVVVQEFLIAEAARRDLHVEDEELEQAQMAATEGLAVQGSLPEVLTERYGSEAGWKQIVSRRLRAERAERAVRDELGAAVEVTDEQVAANASRFAAELARPARLRARQVYAESPERIRAAQADLADGIAFVDLAQKYNEGDGDMGWMALSAAPPELVESMDGLEVGEFSEVVRSPLGYHLFQLLGREEASELTPEESAAEIRRLLQAEEADTAYRRWLVDRFEARGVQLHEDALDQVRCCRRGLPYVPAPEES